MLFLFDLNNYSQAEKFVTLQIKIVLTFVNSNLEKLLFISFFIFRKKEWKWKIGENGGKRRNERKI